MNIGKGIQQIRKEKGFTQEVLSGKTGITQAALSQIENGTRPGEETIAKICIALNIPESMLYIYSIEKDDVPEERRPLFDQLFPVIKDLITHLATDPNPEKNSK